jgi:hypothetical protein
VALVGVLPDAAPPEEAVDPPLPQDEEERARTLRVNGLWLVLLTALVHPIVSVLQGWLGEAAPAPSSWGHDWTASALYWTVVDFTVVALLAYVLVRQGRSLQDLGLRVRGSDLAWGGALAVLGLVPWAIDGLTAREPGGWLPSPAAWEGITLLGLGALLGESAKIQLVLVTYVITEVRALSSSTLLAVAASVGLQELYLQQPLPGIATALIFAVFYWRTRRAAPLLLAGVVDGLWFWLRSAPAAG